jgi:hypothetical protein
MAKKHYPLPKRFSAALSEDAYARLRAINAETGLSNNYCLTVLLENLDDMVDGDQLASIYRRFIEEHAGER